MWTFCVVKLDAFLKQSFVLEKNQKQRQEKGRSMLVIRHLTCEFIRHTFAYGVIFATYNLEPLFLNKTLLDFEYEEKYTKPVIR